MRKFSAQEEVRFSKRTHIDIEASSDWFVQSLLTKSLLTGGPVYQSMRRYFVFSFHVLKL